MSIAKVEFRMFSGPAEVDLGGVDKPSVVELRFGPKGDTGNTGATGSTGPAGPNSVTSATSSDGTCQLHVDDLILGDRTDNEGHTLSFIFAPVPYDGDFGGDVFFITIPPFAGGFYCVTENNLGIPDKLTNGTISGTLAINSTTITYGTGAAAAHRAALGVMEANPSTAYIVDDFAGNTTASPTIGDLGWFSFASGGGSGALIAAPATTYPNMGLRTLTCGNATNAGQVIYLTNWTSIFSYDWEACFIIAASQTTDCDVICGFTKDNAALGIGKFGGISIGVRYSSATDTNWMYYTKNTNTTFAANDANNYSVSSGVAVSTAYNTFRIRCTSGTVEMSVNGGAWTSVNTSGITLAGVWIPYFYVSTRTTASKSATIDYFSFKATNLSR